MPGPVRLRTLAASDLGTLTATFPPSWGTTHHDNLCEQIAGRLTLIVAWTHDEPDSLSVPVGRVFIAWDGPRRAAVRARYPDCPEIHTLAVTEAFERRGIGTALVSACEREARRRGVRMVGLGTDPTVPRAHSLYHRLGYLRSDIDHYDDVYQVAGPDGTVHTARDPARWLVKHLDDGGIYYAHYDPEARTGTPLHAHIRKATANDSRDITDVWAERSGEAPTDFYDKIHDAMATGWGHTWVAVFDDTIVAYGQLRWSDDYFGQPGWALTGVNTRISHRRRGLGHTLTITRLQWLREQGASEVFCCINSTNLASIDLHHRLGFERVRRDVQPADKGTSDLYRADLTR